MNRYYQNHISVFFLHKNTYNCQGMNIFLILLVSFVSSYTCLDTGRVLSVLQDVFALLKKPSVIVNFECISYLTLVFLWLTLKEYVCWVSDTVEVVVWRCTVGKQLCQLKVEGGPTEIVKNGLNSFMTGFPDIETSPMICRANQWPGSYMIGINLMKELFKKLFLSEAVALRYTIKKMFLKISKNSQGNICVRAPF